MNFIYLSLPGEDPRIFLELVVFIGPLVIAALLYLLRSLLQRQIDERVKSKIPDPFKKFVKVRVNLGKQKKTQRNSFPY